MAIIISFYIIQLALNMIAKKVAKFLPDQSGKHPKTTYAKLFKSILVFHSLQTSSSLNIHKFFISHIVPEFR